MDCDDSLRAGSYFNWYHSVSEKVFWMRDNVTGLRPASPIRRATSHWPENFQRGSMTTSALSDAFTSLVPPPGVKTGRPLAADARRRHPVVAAHVRPIGPGGAQRQPEQHGIPQWRADGRAGLELRAVPVGARTGEQVRLQHQELPGLVVEEQADAEPVADVVQPPGPRAVVVATEDGPESRAELQVVTLREVPAGADFRRDEAAAGPTGSQRPRAAGPWCDPIRALPDSRPAPGLWPACSRPWAAHR